MKITAHISKQALDEVIGALKQDAPVMDLAIIDKVYFYLFADVFKKLQKKQIDKADDFSGKPIKLEFKYQDAAALWNELNKVQTDNIYRRTCCRVLKDQIHQKLA